MFKKIIEKLTTEKKTMWGGIYATVYTDIYGEVLQVVYGDEPIPFTTYVIEDDDEAQRLLDATRIFVIRTEEDGLTYIKPKD